MGDKRGKVNKDIPQRKPNKAMSGEELLNKAFHGTHKTLTVKQRKEKELKDFLQK